MLDQNGHGGADAINGTSVGEMMARRELRSHRRLGSDPA
jgi:hypothetical protein